MLNLFVALHQPLSDAGMVFGQGESQSQKT